MESRVYELEEVCERSIYHQQSDSEPTPQGRRSKEREGGREGVREVGKERGRLEDGS